ncbi:MAG: carboxypeptidase-like regulatory domain-containing protein [Candidatus Bathyarchaeia archaeon]
MKQLMPIALTVLLLINSIALTNIQTTKATIQLHQGDLILSNSDVVLIEGNFEINGSIIIQENATLILKNAIINFTQTEGYQYNVTLQNGSPRLQVENTTINTNNHMYIHIYSNSTAKINKLTSPAVALDINEQPTVTIENSTIYRMAAGGNSNLNMSNSLLLFDLGTYDNTKIEISNSTLGSIHAEGGQTINVSNSTIIYHIAPRAYSTNLSINQLKPGFFTYWNFRQNCSVTTAPTGKASNITIKNTQVNGWLLYLWLLTNATITQSKIKDIFTYGSTTVTANNSIFYSIHAYDNTHIEAHNSEIHEAELHKNAKLWLINSTIHTTTHYDESKTYIAWLLSVHVIDSIGQNVPYANVTATYANGTIAHKTSTNIEGTTTFKLIEKIITATGEQTIKNYNITANYEEHSTTTTIDITENKEITLKLENLIIPELSFATILLLIAAASILILTFRKR